MHSFDYCPTITNNIIARVQGLSAQVYNTKYQMHEEQNLREEANEPTTRKPSTMNMKKLEKIQNNRYLNQSIYQLFVTGRHAQCMNLIEKCPADQFKLYMKSLIYKNEFKLDKSLALLTECQGMNKLNFNYLKEIAKNFYLLGKYKSSLEVAKEAHKLNASDYEIFYILAKIAVAMKDIDGGIANLGRAIAKEPNEQSYIFLAKLLMQKGSHREAAQQLQKALLISPQNDQIHQMIGDIEGSFGHRDDSLRQYGFALEINPNQYQAMFSTAALKQANNQIEQALAAYTNAYRLTQNSAALWNNLAALLQKKNKEIAAYCCLKKALFLDPFRYDIHLNLGFILMKVKKYVGAQMHFRTALKLKKNPQVFHLLALCLAELGDLANAQKCFEQIFRNLSLEPKNKLQQAKYRINYLCFLLKKGDKKKCTEVLYQLEGFTLDTEQSEKVKQIKQML